MRVSLLFLWLLVGSAFAGDLPDSALTPGVADPALTRERLCTKGFSTKTVRNVSQATKREVYARYGLVPNKGGCPCEVDHLIPLTIGGANSLENLWPQSYRGKWSAHVKDRLENSLRRQVCSGELKLAEAQRAIASDWIAMYKRCFKSAKAAC